MMYFPKVRKHPIILQREKNQGRISVILRELVTQSLINEKNREFFFP